MISKPTVEVWAISEVLLSMWDRLPRDPYNPVRDIDALHEGAGRACYESWSRPNPATATTKSYLEHIIEVGHESVLAHGSITMYFTGISRSLSLELIRSRFLAFSQVSQRYVPAKSLDWVCPPRYLGDEDVMRFLDDEFNYNIRSYNRLVDAEESAFHANDRVLTTKDKKLIREAARAVLPNMTETRVVVSGNVRAWRDFVGIRWSEHADAEIDRLAAIVASRLHEVAPYSTFDLKREES